MTEKATERAVRCVRNVGLFIANNAEKIAGEFDYPYVCEDGFTIRIRSLMSTKELATIEVEKELFVVGPKGDVGRYDTL